MPKTNDTDVGSEHETDEDVLKHIISYCNFRMTMITLMSCHSRLLKQLRKVPVIQSVLRLLDIGIKRVILRRESYRNLKILLNKLEKD